MAKKNAIAHVIFAVSVTFVIMVCLRIFEDDVAGMFTENEQDQKYIKDVLSVLSIYLVLDAVHGVNTGIVRALGKQF